MIAIIDYDMGNLRSVQKALAVVGHDEAIVTSDAAEILRAERLILPGVGAFADAMKALASRGLIEPLKQSIAQGKPTLGICLGMQLLFEVSHEDGEHRGLGLLAGSVEHFDVPRPLKVPHMGWNSLDFHAPSPLLAGVAPGEYVYFVHSYYCQPRDAAVVAATSTYDRPFCASIVHNNLYATQFHPEKSQRAGLQILKNFAELS
jgi:glutamine amidotransferase